MSSSSAAAAKQDWAPSLKLNDGNEIPMFAYGLGTANYNSSGKRDEKVVGLTTMAIKNGFYHLDGAEVYGNEEELGAAIKAAGVPRSQLFVTTKLWKPASPDVRTAFNTSLAKLGLDYVDLYLVHQPYMAATPAELQAIWAEVEAIKASGQARSVGVSNFLREHVETVLATAKVPPAINQLEFHPYLQRADLVAFLRKHDIAVSAYGPLTAVTKAAPGPLDPVFEELAEKYGVTPGEVALRWVVDQGVVAITTSSSEERLQGYVQKLPTFKLTPDEVAKISEVGQQKHFRGFFKDKFDPEDRQ